MHSRSACSILGISLTSIQDGGTYPTLTSPGDFTFELAVSYICNNDKYKYLVIKSD